MEHRAGWRENWAGARMMQPFPVEATFGHVFDLDDDQIAYEFPCQLPYAPVVHAIVAFERQRPLSGLSLVFAGKPHLGQLSRGN